MGLKKKYLACTEIPENPYSTSPFLLPARCFMCMSPTAIAVAKLGKMLHLL